jgi:Mg2+-importing ATPase
MTVSSNFGNILSVLIASAFLPFLPMLPLQILMLNLIYDISCIAVPWDNVDMSYLRLPRKWNAKSIPKFMFAFGPISSIFDIVTFAFLIYIICPFMFHGAHYNMLSGTEQNAFQMVFHTGWFIESLWTQTLVVHMIRTKRIPFIQSRASAPVMAFTISGIIFGTVVPYIFGDAVGMIGMPHIFYYYLVGIVLIYMLLIAIVKVIFVHKNKELL